MGKKTPGIPGQNWVPGLVVGSKEIMYDIGHIICWVLIKKGVQYHILQHTGGHLEQDICTYMEQCAARLIFPLTIYIINLTALEKITFFSHQPGVQASPPCYSMHLYKLQITAVKQRQRVCIKKTSWHLQQHRTTAVQLKATCTRSWHNTTDSTLVQTHYKRWTILVHYIMTLVQDIIIRWWQLFNTYGNDIHHEMIVTLWHEKLAIHMKWVTLWRDNVAIQMK